MVTSHQRSRLPVCGAVEKQNTYSPTYLVTMFGRVTENSRVFSHAASQCSPATPHDKDVARLLKEYQYEVTCTVCGIYVISIRFAVPSHLRAQRIRQIQSSLASTSAWHLRANFRIASSQVDDRACTEIIRCICTGMSQRAPCARDKKICRSDNVISQPVPPRIVRSPRCRS